MPREENDIHYVTVNAKRLAALEWVAKLAREYIESGLIPTRDGPLAKALAMLDQASM